jgi:D-lyxose ketol-isomerase
MITVINREYCKKILILLPNQTHPQQYHKIKEESFFILYGEVDLYLNGELKKYKVGDLVTIEPNVKHKFFSKTGAIIEEISSTHNRSDSYYTDEKIMQNKNRKTYIKFWID